MATHRLEEQWATVERSFYEEDDQLSLGPVLDECVQWRTQIPYLRMIGKNPMCVSDDSQPDLVDQPSDDKRIKDSDNQQNDKVPLDHNLSLKARKESKAKYLLTLYLGV